MKNDRVLSLLGLCQRAGLIASGEDMAIRAVREQKAVCVIVAMDASDNTKKLFNDKCNSYGVKVYFYKTREELGYAIGKDQRASVAVLDEGFALKIGKLLGDDTATPGGV